MQKVKHTQDALFAESGFTLRIFALSAVNKFNVNDLTEVHERKESYRFFSHLEIVEIVNAKSVTVTADGLNSLHHALLSV